MKIDAIRHDDQQKSNRVFVNCTHPSYERNEFLNCQDYPRKHRQKEQTIVKQEDEERH